MKLVEKKCPNCGAKLNFNETDKNCKCEYCKSAFEIERDITKEDLLNQFDLKPLKKISIIFYVIFAVIFVLVAVFITSISIHIFKETNTVRKDNKSNEEIVKKISDLSNFEIKGIETSAKLLINPTAEGVNDLNYSFKLNGDINIEKTYLAFKDNNNNIIITICKAKYQNFFNQESIFTVYIPVVFKDIKKKDFSATFSGEVSAPEFYLNDEKNTYVYAYSSLDEAYNSVVKPLENEYIISEK